MLPYFYLGDFLATMPGMDVRWGKMQRLYVGARGLGGTALNSRMLLLWDGLPLNDPFTGELTAGHFVPLVDVERIEVIRGAGASMYGANAYSGVVNVITGASRGKDSALGLRSSALLGSFLTSRLQAAYDQNVGPVHVGTSVEAFRTDGPFPAADRFTETGTIRAKNDDVKSVALGAHATYKDLRFTGRYIYGERGRPGTFSTDSHGNQLDCTTCHSQASSYGQGAKYPATKSSCGTCHFAPNDREVQHRGYLALSFDRALSKNFTVKASAYHNEYRTDYRIFRETEFLGQTAEDRPEIMQRASGGEAYISHTYEGWNSAVVGADIRRYEVASDMINSPEHGNRDTQSNAAFFLEDEIKPFDWLAITAGGRLDYNPLFKPAFSPRGGIVISPLERLAFRMGYTRAFRNPSLSELYVVDTRGKYLLTGNPSLIPEWLSSVEGGVAYSLLVKEVALHFAGFGFYNTASHLISFAASGGGDHATFFNLHHVTIKGAEIEVAAEYRQNINIKVSANYSYQKVVDQDGNPATYAPESKANFVLLAKQGRFGGVARVRFIGDRLDDMGIKLPVFTTLDTSFQFEMGSGFGVQLWAQNLTDDLHQESLGIPAARRSFFLVLNYRNE